MLRSDNEEFDVWGVGSGIRMGLRWQLGSIVGIYKLDKWMSEKCVGVIVWCVKWEKCFGKGGGIWLRIFQVWECFWWRLLWRLGWKLRGFQGIVDEG